MRQSSSSLINNMALQTRYQRTNPFAVRRSRATMLRNNYSGCIPVIIEPADHMWSSKSYHTPHGAPRTTSLAHLPKGKEEMRRLHNLKERKSMAGKHEGPLAWECKSHSPFSSFSSSSSSSCAVLSPLHPTASTLPRLEKDEDVEEVMEDADKPLAREACSRAGEFSETHPRPFLAFSQSSPTLGCHDRSLEASSSTRRGLGGSSRERNTTPPPAHLYPSSSTFLSAQSFKMVLPTDKTVGEVILLLRERLALSPHEAVFISVVSPAVSMADSIGFLMPPNNTPLGTLYEKYRNADGFLYLAYCMENTFGAE